jgi:teichuronic acid biosynthesis glycosyltransferase TuaG
MVSIITPTFNSEEWIRATYESILAQSYCNWEWIVTDDCSCDSTVSILTKIESEDSRVKVFKNKVNSGAAVSRNNSISKATGDYIAFIDSDDLWVPSKLTKQIQFMENNRIDFSFTAYSLINSDSRKLEKEVDTHLNSALDYEDMLRKKATLGCSTVMLRRSAFEDIMMPDIRTGQDYGLWLKLLKTGVKAHPLAEVLTQYRLLPNSISRNKFKKAKRQWQIYRDIEDLGVFKSLICFFFYGWRAVFRK